MKQEDLIIDARRDNQYSVKLPNVMTYYNIEFASAELQFENTWKEYFDSEWIKSITYMKSASIHYTQAKSSEGIYNDYYSVSSNNSETSNDGRP